MTWAGHFRVPVWHFVADPPEDDDAAQPAPPRAKLGQAAP